MVKNFSFFFIYSALSVWANLKMWTLLEKFFFFKDTAQTVAMDKIHSSHPLGAAGGRSISSLSARFPLARGASSGEWAICVRSSFRSFKQQTGQWTTRLEHKLPTKWGKENQTGSTESLSIKKKKNKKLWDGSLAPALIGWFNSVICWQRQTAAT